MQFKTESPLKERNIIIFAGAGASTAVDSKNYPTTIEFYKKLPSEIKSHSLFREIYNYLKSNHTSEIDIEVILWCLDELCNFCNAAIDKTKVTGWILDGDRLSKAINTGSSLSPFRSTSNKAYSELISLRDLIHKQVFNIYIKKPAKEQLNETWIPLLDILIKSQANIEIFTTNYDIVIEEALDTISKPDAPIKIDNGWSDGTYRTLNKILWEKKGQKNLLTKLHGSINWHKSGLDDEIHIGAPIFTGDHNKHSIIYPGFKGGPTDTLFKNFHSYLERALNRSDAIIFIGFAFRDEYINNIIDRRKNNNSDIIIINPSNDLEIGFDYPKNRMHRIQKGFNIESISEALSIMLRSTP